MKKILLVLLLACNLTHAQNIQKVWDLLLVNKREEARKLFNKDFGKKKDSDIDLLILDALLDKEQGRLSYDKAFLEKLSKFKESKNYLYPLWYQPFVIGNVKSDGFDDLTFEKMDFVSNNIEYSNDPFIIYFKSVFERRRQNYTSYDSYIKKLGIISKWQFCGVFENMNGSGLETEYEAEYYAKNDKTFNANSNGFVRWYIPVIKQNEACHYYLNEKEYGDGIMYAQTFIDSDTDRQVILNFGGSGPLKIFLNDVEIYVNDNISNSDINSYHLKFNLKKGTNRLVLKSSIHGAVDYFYAAIKDINQNEIESLSFSDVYKPYNKSTIAEINPVEANPYYEDFLQQKLIKDPGNILNTLLLFDAYMNNHKYEKAYDVIEGLIAKYPNSSLLNVKLIGYYNGMEDVQKSEEIRKNIELNDEDYYYSIIYKFQDEGWLGKANISELEKYREKSKKLHSNLYALLYEYMILIRNSDIDLSIKKMEEIIGQSYNNELFVTLFSPLYTTFKNDKAKTISMLEEIVSKRDNSTAQDLLISNYNSSGRKEDAKKLIDQRIQRYPYFNYVYNSGISYANNDSDYEKSVKYADIALGNFPYSFLFMEEKGKAYNSQKKINEAEKLFKEALVYYSANSSLRKILYDITKVPDEIEQVASKDIYAIIKQRRKSKMQCDYGVNVLLDEYIASILPEGGRRAKVINLYEVIAENGIEELKEYKINGNNLNILKAEIVKPDGSIVPGEKNYNTVIFTNLKVNDVIYVEYETSDNGYGRFYKDFNISYYFNGVYPSQQSIFGIIHPIEAKFSYDVMNGEIPSKTKKINNKNTYISWERKNIPAMPLDESFSPSSSDLVNQVRISSIKSWSDISNWYADLVKKNIKMDYISIKTYNEIFPEGVGGLTQYQIAYKIYKYVGENITYSSLDFRQSGYVPQKPSKTINTKLGDCKDVSTLFVAMAERAGLKANLVLVQTNDNGTQSLKLPSINFNHCIVRLTIDNKDIFVEMTDNYLPFMAMPSTLYKAKALVVSFDKNENEKSGIINIPSDNALENKIETVSVITIEDNLKKFTNTHICSGSNKSYYNELFSQATTEDVRKKEFEEELKNGLNKVISLESFKLIANERFGEEIKYETKFLISEKLQSVGSLKILEIPYIDKPYTRDIITTDKRNFDIEYATYERVNNYKTEVILNIPPDKKFTEIPQTKNLKYKGHIYDVTYELVKPNQLKVVRKVKTSWNNIQPVDYPEFKKFVEEVIASEEEIVGFK
ncbi:transglutaminase domain-containing protein [Flavobacterium cerinum]|uniref:Transglutaminase-like domain-containing protein n=1 Tax=Flavobacterium cerinum TaxID=2502784 RepID=A0A3S3U1T0_9FLAO|nr:transglutaminase domain-containing protein [Flavobacterium cerinum]RWW98856.1 hypothetical protein EPI11_13095 [Flavobacterium cerinum]